MLHDGLTHPVDLRVTTDGVVAGVDHNDLVVLVRGILRHPVAVEDAQTGNLAAGSLLKR